LGRNTFSKAELASVWSGRAYLLWRNVENIPLPMATGSAGNGVRRLQSLLRDAGVRTISVSGSYDETTLQAVKNFQTSRRISATGEIGPITLIQLYKAVNAGSFPTFTTSGKGGGR
jgi:general secretion pathway protein A